MIHLHIACNDYRNGIHTGQVESIQFFGADDVDPMLMLNGNRLVCGILYSMKGRERYLRLGHLSAVEILSYTTWVGNWCWDSALVSDADAAKVANYLRKRGWQNEGGWIDIGEKWDSEEPFTEKDFQEQTV